MPIAGEDKESVDDLERSGEYNLAPTSIHTRGQPLTFGQKHALKPNSAPHGKPQDVVVANLLEDTTRASTIQNLTKPAKGENK